MMKIATFIEDTLLPRELHVAFKLLFNKITLNLFIILFKNLHFFFNYIVHRKYQLKN